MWERRWQDKPDEPLPVYLSAYADWQFRKAIAAMRELGLQHHEFYGLLVVERSNPTVVVRLEFPKQWVSGASCEALSPDVRAVRDGLADHEAIAGSIHFHPMSTHSAAGFLSWTDYNLLHGMALEQAADLLVGVPVPLRPLTLPAGGQVRAEGRILLSCTAAQQVHLEPAVTDIQFAAYTYCLVNAADSYYGKVLRTIVCMACGQRERFLHPAEVHVAPAAELQVDSQAELRLTQKLRLSLQEIRYWPKRGKHYTRDEEKVTHEGLQSRRQALLTRASSLASELWAILEELEQL
jgi:hypothetical protein